MGITVQFDNNKPQFKNYYTYVWKKRFGSNDNVYGHQIVEALRHYFKEEYNAILSSKSFNYIRFPDEKTYAMFLIKWS